MTNKINYVILETIIQGSLVAERKFHFDPYT